MLTRETVIQMAKDAGFNVGQDAGGEYVAPQYADSVGTLERLVLAAYQAGRVAERKETPPPMVIKDPDVVAVVNSAADTERRACAELVRQLRDSITWFSHDSGAMRSALEQAEKHILARGKKGGAT
jgi:hypothetical protein